MNKEALADIRRTANVALSGIVEAINGLASHVSALGRSSADVAGLLKSAFGGLKADAPAEKQEPRS